jgi:DNA polymerase (family 10)
MITNHEVARQLEEIAEVLELKEDSSFRIRAYQRAARLIESLEEPLTQIRARGVLQELPGIGEAMAAKIEELLDTGHMQRHDALVAEFPPGVLALLQVPGIGPRTAHTLHDLLGITNLAELEAAARAGRIRSLKGFGAKTEAKILESLERLHQRSERLPLAQAYPLAQQIIAQLRAQAPVREIAAAGSLRRMCDTVGDLDLLVTSADPARVMQAVTELPQVRDVLLSGPTKTTIRTEIGLQVDVRVVAPDDFGAALQYFTGSKDHNVKLRTYAVGQGFKLSEYGIFRAETGERIGGRTEEEMYRLLGMPWIPPELREDRGEIEAALVGQLPDLVTERALRGDLHTHTEWSDGRTSIRAMADAARARGYEYLAICDHSIGLGIAHGLTPERLRAQLREIRALNAELDGFTLLAGSEVDIRRDGSLDFPDELLAELDLCVASVHSAFGLSEEEQTARVLTALENPYLDILGHPTGRLIGSRDPLRLDMMQILAAAAQRGVALEVNSWPDRLDLSDGHILLARQLGAKLVIDTDAHAPEHLDIVHFGVAIARRGWTTPSDILNTRPLSELRASLRRHRG